MTPGIYLWECNVQPAFSRQLAIFLMELDFSLHTKTISHSWKFEFQMVNKSFNKSLCGIYSYMHGHTHKHKKCEKGSVSLATIQFYRP